MRALKEVLDMMGNIELPVPKDDYVMLVGLCVKFGNFEFQGDEFAQINGLAMGSPLSAVLANLYMELLEKEHYLPILGDSVTMYRYVDDMIAFIPHETDIDDLLRRLNGVEPAIQLTCEEEKDGTLPFLDVVIRRFEHNLKFSVYRKPTNKDDFVHFFSSHSMRTKTGIVIGFFLRAYRICSPEFLQTELDYIRKAFKKLKFPEALLITLQKKAHRIKSRTDSQRQQGQEQNQAQQRKQGLHTYVVAPNSIHADKVAKMLAPDLKIVTTSGKKIGQVVRKAKYKVVNTESIVYKIPCGKCSKSYFGETGRGLKKRIQEHRNDLRNHRTSKALVMHADRHGHLPKWDKAEPLHTDMTRVQRWLIEAAYISTEDVTNVSPGFFKLHSSIAKQIKRENRSCRNDA